MGRHEPRRDPTGRVIHERDDDFDVVAKVARFIERYKIVWIAVVAASAWLGHHLVEPLDAIPVVQAQVIQLRDSVHDVNKRLDKADEDRAAIVQVIKVFGKVICAGLSSSDRYKYDIDCRDLPVPDTKTKGGL